MKTKTKTMDDRVDAYAYIIGAGRVTRHRRHVRCRDGVSAGGSIRHWRVQGFNTRTSCTRIRTGGFGLHSSVWMYSHEFHKLN